MSTVLIDNLKAELYRHRDALKAQFRVIFVNLDEVTSPLSTILVVRKGIGTVNIMYTIEMTIEKAILLLRDIAISFGVIEV